MPQQYLKSLLFIFLWMGFTPSGFAQFSAQGKISFERKTNLKQEYLTNEGNEWIKSRIDEMAPLAIDQFTLLFKDHKSLYRFDSSIDVPGFSFNWLRIAKENEVYTDFTANKTLSRKTLYDEVYFIEDSLSHFVWKIEDEMRHIAGFACRKAVTRIWDSVVVVAFYTDELMLSGGPEGFNGLPGMILGLAIPRLYTTWFATRVDLLPQQVSGIKPKRKEKEMSQADFMAALQKRFGSTNGPRNKTLWWISL